MLHREAAKVVAPLGGAYHARVVVFGQGDERTVAILFRGDRRRRFSRGGSGGRCAKVPGREQPDSYFHWPGEALRGWLRLPTDRESFLTVIQARRLRRRAALGRRDEYRRHREWSRRRE